MFVRSIVPGLPQLSRASATETHMLKSYFCTSLVLHSVLLIQPPWSCCSVRWSWSWFYFGKKWSRSLCGSGAICQATSFQADCQQLWLFSPPWPLLAFFLLIYRCDALCNHFWSRKHPLANGSLNRLVVDCLWTIQGFWHLRFRLQVNM